MNNLNSIRANCTNRADEQLFESIANAINDKGYSINFNAVPVATLTEEDAKLKRVHLKDELYAMLKKTSQS